MKTVYIIIAFCIGLLFGHVISPQKFNPEPPDISETQMQQKQLALYENDYSKKETFYKLQSDSLFKEVGKYKFLVNHLKESVSSERIKVFAEVSKLKKDSLFSKDTLKLDSLAYEIKKSDFISDSLNTNCENENKLFERLIAVRDSELSICNYTLMGVKNISQEQILREQKLTQDLNTSIKQQRKTIFKNRVLAAGMLFISGIATTLYIKSRQ
jgi:hypothetical protein